MEWNGTCLRQKTDSLFPLHILLGFFRICVVMNKTIEQKHRMTRKNYWSPVGYLEKLEFSFKIEA